MRSGHADTLRLLLGHPAQGDLTGTPDPPAGLLNQANGDGWTAAHMAAALGLKVTTSSMFLFPAFTAVKTLSSAL